MVDFLSMDFRVRNEVVFVIVLLNDVFHTEIEQYETIVACARARFVRVYVRKSAQ